MNNGKEGRNIKARSEIETYTRLTLYKERGCKS